MKKSEKIHGGLYFVLCKTLRCNDCNYYRNLLYLYLFGALQKVTTSHERLSGEDSAMNNARVLKYINKYENKE